MKIKYNGILVNNACSVVSEIQYAAATLFPEFAPLKWKGRGERGDCAD